MILELDETLTSRDTVNTKMRAILDEATDPWGIKINRVELKNIMPPAEIQDAMERQMKAERERRESILRAEGEKKSAILLAEGEKELQYFVQRLKNKLLLKRQKVRLKQLSQYRQPLPKVSEELTTQSRVNRILQ